MCRLFFIFDHKLTKKEMKCILSKRNGRKYTPGINQSIDDGPHMDGFGIAHIDENKWKIDKTIEEPDIDFDKISKSELIIIHMRKNCQLEVPCLISNGKTSLENTHPFFYENNIFAHNGSIYHFEEKKHLLKKYISKDLFPKIKGETDTEWIFFLFLTLLRKNKKSVSSVLEKLFKILKTIFSEFNANFIFSNNDFSVITRYSYKIPANSLYYDTSNGIIISSEPITKNYKLVPENTMIYVDHNEKMAFLHYID